MAEALNMREAASPLVRSLKILSRGAHVTILETLTGEPYSYEGEEITRWHRIKVGSILGYVAAAYIAEVEARRELRGAWIPDVTFMDVLDSAEGIRNALDYLQDHGFNAVFPAVWNRGLTAYPSRVMEQNGFARQDPLYQGFDPLGIVVSEGKRRGMAVLPWFEYGFASSPEPDGGPILRAKPDWGAMHSGGGLARHGNLTWMNSLHPEVQQFLLDLVLETISIYNLDGIQGDDRWPAMPFNAGYDVLSRQKYRNAEGKDPPTEGKDPKWVKFRADQMTLYLSRVRSAIRNAKPGCIISMAPAPYPFGLRELMQDSDRWIRDGLVDLLIPQLYRPDFSSYRSELSNMVVNWSPSIRSRCAPGIAMKANNTNLSGSDIESMVKHNRDLGLAGQAFFHYGSLRAAANTVSSTLKKDMVFGNAANLPPAFMVA